jgi:hypothetical protein
MSNQVSSDVFLRTSLQWFVSDPPPSSFKKLILSTPRLLQGLHMMYLAKAVPDGIKDKECKRFALQERPPAPYLPEKDPVQEKVSTLKSDQSFKTTIGEDVELRIPIWHTGTCKAFLMHVSRRDQETGHLQGLQGSLPGLCSAAQSGEASKGRSGSFNSCHEQGQENFQEIFQESF